jgi:hypothetical protein
VKKIYNLFILIFLVFIFNACGGGGGGGSSSSTDTSTSDSSTSSDTNSGSSDEDTSSKTGTFIDSAVDGLTYTINGVDKKTQNGGRFTYNTNDQITFKLGSLVLGTVTGSETITPVNFFADENATIYSTKVINMGRILQTFDSDGNPDNGINLSTEAQNLDIDMNIDWSNDGNISDLATRIDSSKTLRTKAQSLAHLKDSLPNIDDPLFKYQWYIKNDGVVVNSSNVRTIVGNDLNISNIWTNYTGWNDGSPIKVQVVDDGIKMDHSDLKRNIDLLNAYSYATFDNKANPVKVSDTHGTSVAGIIGAVGWNGIGMRGIAPNVKLVPFKLSINSDKSLLINRDVLDKAWITSPDAYNIHVSSNSWGIAYDQDSVYDDVLGSSIARALRDSKGRIYVVAAGNYKVEGVNSNLSRMKNNPYVITVAALNHNDQYSYYSQGGANVLVSAYGGGLDSVEPTIPTTTMKVSNPTETFSEDRKKEYSTFNGTSAATPMVSAGIALTLEACSDLTYQDIQYLIAKTAIKIDPNDKEYYALSCEDNSGCDLSSNSTQLKWRRVYKDYENDLVFKMGNVLRIAQSARYKVSDTSTNTLSYGQFMLLPSFRSNFIPMDENSTTTPREQVDSLLASSSKSDMWITNGAGLHYNENYGFGKLNVTGMINMCSNGYTLLDTEQSFDSGDVAVNKSDNNITQSINVSSSFKARWVGLTIDSISKSINNPKVELESPSGTIVQLNPFTSGLAPNIDGTMRFGAYSFMDETINGDWKVYIKGIGTTTNKPQIRSLKLEIKGY